VVCHDGNGGTTLPSSAATIGTTNANVYIAPPIEDGCVTWDLLKTDTRHSLFAGVAPYTNGHAYIDTGQGTNAYRKPSRNSTGDIVLGTGAVTKLHCSTVAGLLASAEAGAQTCVTDWNGIIGACVGGGTLYSPAVYTGSAWDCP
jgi:hypothetical protein